MAPQFDTAAGQDPVRSLQNRWYNTLTTNLHLNPAQFQIRSSPDPLIGSSEDLWAIQDVLPPFSLTFNSSIHASDRFSIEYIPVASQLQFPESAFREHIGEQNYQKWTSHLKNITHPPTEDKLPALFRQWALLAAPSVMSVGVADLTRMIIINRALKSLQPYTGPNAKPIEFKTDFAQVKKMVENSTGSSFTFDSPLASDDVENSWTGGINNGLAGLWSGSGSDSRLSRHFATSRISVHVELKAYAESVSVPGSWYNSALLNIAYTVPNGLPWPAAPNPTWEEVFGPNGSMRRLAISLVVAEGVYVTVTSDAQCSESDQQVIKNNAAKGLWPLYIPERDGAATNIVSFDSAEKMNIETVTEPGNLVVIGHNVLSIAQYLGHAVA
jgi:hypothetical protein